MWLFALNTYKKAMHKILLCTSIIFATISFKLHGQTNHTVSTVGNAFSPSSITINVGDTVTWINTGGAHNVNGKTSTFAGNAESFDNGTASSGWTFKHVFTVSGTNDYQCDVHAGGMKGKVIVNAVMNIKPIGTSASQIYPNPTSGLVYLPINTVNSQVITVYNLQGQVVVGQNFDAGAIGLINLSHLNNGFYTIGVAVENQATSFAKVSVVK